MRKELIGYKKNPLYPEAVGEKMLALRFPMLF